LSYSIFRVQGIKTLSDLRGIGKHNADRVSDTNLDIDREKSSENIELVKCDSYLKRFSEITLDMRREHEERMKTTRSDRRKSFEQAINGAKNDVACEFLFTSDEEFFKGKSKAEIQSWAQDSLEFVTDEIGLSHERIIHASVHMDEKTPHLHIVAVPLTEIYDRRRKEHILTISRHQFIKTKDDLSSLQDKYNDLMNERGYNLERGTPKQLRHEKVLEFKEKTNYHEKTAQEAERVAGKKILEARQTLGVVKTLETEVKTLENKNKSLIDKTKTLENKNKALEDQAAELEKKAKSLEGAKTNLEVSISNRKSEMEDIKKEITHAKKIDDMEFKEKGTLFNLKHPKTVELALEDFQSLKALAKASETFKRENEAYKELYEKERARTKSLSEENRSLTKQLDKSKEETTWYKNQYERLGKLFDNIKDRYQERAPEIYEDFQKIVGFAKYQVNRTINFFSSQKQYDENKMTKPEKEGYTQAKEVFKDRRRNQDKSIGFERE
jgi:hypothetical protein